jgi:hypothetical protein
LNNIGIYGIKAFALKLYKNLVLQINYINDKDEDKNNELNNNKSDNLVNIINKRID